MQSILILYDAPEEVPAGIVKLILPDGSVPLTLDVPMLRGDAKLPVASDR